MAQNLGQLYIVSAPSGAGKTSLIAQVLQEVTNLEVSVSLTTRAARPGEVNGINYHFVSLEDFNQRKKQGEFFESAEVFGNFYATSKRVIEEKLQAGIDIILEIDWQGAQQVRQLMPSAKSIFILPPSIAALQQRLEGRGQDSAEIIAGRMQQALSELSHWQEYDFLLVNDDFAQAAAELKSIFVSQRLAKARQEVVLQELLAEFS